MSSGIFLMNSRSYFADKQDLSTYSKRDENDIVQVNTWLHETKPPYTVVHIASVSRIRVSCMFRVAAKRACISIHTRLFIHATSLRVLVCRAKLCRFPWKTHPVPANAIRFVSFRFVAPRTNAHGIRFFRFSKNDGWRACTILTSYRSWICGPACARYSVLAVSNTNSWGILVTFCRDISW